MLWNKFVKTEIDMTTTYKTEEYIYAALALIGFVSATCYMLKFTQIDEEAYDAIEEEWKKLTGR